MGALEEEAAATLAVCVPATIALTTDAPDDEADSDVVAEEEAGGVMT